MNHNLSKIDQDKQMQKLSASLPEGLPHPATYLTELAMNNRKLKQLRQKYNSCTDPSEKPRLKQSEKKYAGMNLESYKRNLIQLDKLHMKATVELKNLAAKMDKLEKFRNSSKEALGV